MAVGINKQIICLILRKKEAVPLKRETADPDETQNRGNNNQPTNYFLSTDLFDTTTWNVADIIVSLFNQLFPYFIAVILELEVQGPSKVHKPPFSPNNVIGDQRLAK